MRSHRPKEIPNACQNRSAANALKNNVVVANNVDMSDISFAEGLDEDSHPSKEISRSSSLLLLPLWHLLLLQFPSKKENTALQLHTALPSCMMCAKYVVTRRDRLTCSPDREGKRND